MHPVELLPTKLKDRIDSCAHSCFIPFVLKYVLCILNCWHQTPFEKYSVRSHKGKVQHFQKYAYLLSYC